MLTARLVAMVLFAVLLSAVPFHAALAAAPDLGTASEFAVLAGTNVTCTDGSVVIGDVGVSPGSAVPFTNTNCTFAGATPPATDAAAAPARTDFLSAYAALQLQSASCTQMPGNLAGLDLAPGVYCIDAVEKAGTLTLTGTPTGGPNDVWIFLVNGALTGTDFSVVMAGGGQPCNVYWEPSAAVTMTTSAFKGNILAGNAIGGSITLTGGTVAGQVLANVAVTMTGASVIGCSSLVPPPIDQDHCKDYCKDYDKDHWKDYWKEYWKDSGKYHCKDHEKDFCKDHYCQDHDKDRCNYHDKDYDKDHDKDNRNRR
jgi:hypothetical protein